MRVAGESGLLGRSIQAAIDAAGTRGMSRAEIAALAEGLGERSAYQQALREIERAGSAVEWNTRWYSLASTEWSVGELQVLSGGDALLRSGAGGEPGFFVARRYLNGARSGDRVVAKALRGRAGRGRRLPEASVVKIIRRAFDSLAGRIERRDGRVYVIPFDRRLRTQVEIAENPELAEGVYVAVAVDHDGSGRSGPLRGVVDRVLGDLDETGVDAEVVITHFGLPTEFPAAVLAEAETFPADPEPSEFAGRRDLRDQVVVTIDGATAKDFDDAICVEKRADGSFDLAVHIADVSHYVTDGSALDLEAFERGTSVYFADQVIPMLPEALSNGLCSLRPGVPRLVQSAFLRIGSDGKILSSAFGGSVIESSRRLTYQEVAALLGEQGGGNPIERSEYAQVLPMLEEAAELAAVLSASRSQRGSIDFDLPAGNLMLDDEGAPVAVHAAVRTLAHRMIEEFMLAANEAVARELAGHEAPALYRVHDAPKPQRLGELRLVLESLGHELPGELESLHPSVLQEVMGEFAGTDEEPFVSALVLRAMQRARYSHRNMGHYALSERHYTHFTSPIRRYPDLVVHRKLRALRAETEGGKEDKDGRARELERLPIVADHCSERERRSERAERELRRWRLVRLLADRLGETVQGRVTGVEPFGLFVELENYFVDGLIAVRDLEDDFYEYEPAAHKLVGQRRGRTFRLADRVEVKIKAVDVERRMIDLVVAGQKAGARPRSKPRRKGRRR